MPHREFLDWSTPLLPALADKLLPPTGRGPLDLGESLLLAPTQQAGRRLREYLATTWRERGGTALLSMEVHPPSFLLQPSEDSPIAHAFDWMPAWQQTLTGIDPESLPALLPQQTEPFSPSIALEFGQRLQRLREELLDAGLDLSSVASSPLLSSEQERWQDLAKLETLYRETLAAAGFIDPTDAKRQSLADFRPPTRIKKLILAGVPDPSPVILSRLQELDNDPDIEIEVWIHAPPSEADHFDAWGSPDISWQTRFLGRPEEPQGWIECLADPSALCIRLEELLRDMPDHPNLAFGLLDDQLLYPIQQCIQAAGHELYHPKPAKLSDSPDLRLLSALQDHRTHLDPVSLRKLWRQPELLKALQPDNPMGLLRDWEKFATHSFPENMETVSQLLPEGSLKTAWKKMKQWVSVEDPIGILEMLEEIHQGRELNPQLPAERYQLRQVHKLADLLQEAARRQKEGQGPSATVLLQVLKNEAVDPPRVEGTFTAEGWLELAYHPAPSLLLTGFQEGKVPAVNKPDPFLPNQLREELGLRSDRDWLARDSYLFHCMIMSRAPGQVRVWVLKRDREGGPQLPSRLLFACEDSTLLQRSALLFSEPPPPPLQPAPKAGLLLHPEHIEQKTPERLSVSAINSYLACPTRFYLSEILKLRCNDDIETEPNAAIFGTLLHEVLQQVVAQGPCSLEQWQQRCTEQLETCMFKQLGDAGRMSMQVFRHSALARLRAAGPVQLDLWEEGWKTIATEQKLERECQGITIVGKIDRIDVHPELGFRIIDYKSSDSPKAPVQTHLGTPREGRESIQLEFKNKTKQWTNLQLPLYRWLATTASEIDPDQPLTVCYFNLPKSVKDTKIEGWRDEADLAIPAEVCLEEVIRLIKAHVWHPTSKATLYDDYTPLLHHGSDWIP
ncbi:PD-(D/E)XK nuclease family protein [Kiritimatiellota bacterium B12222]|nr:PD-(D/E)XK nuclease family protein [Kiritimatiellota bacterium B12222]